MHRIDFCLVDSAIQRLNNQEQVWKQVWKMTFFGLKYGQDLENRVAHRSAPQEFNPQKKRVFCFAKYPQPPPPPMFNVGM